MSAITRYYSLQAGRGLPHIGPVYRAQRNGYQKGYGIGSVISNIIGFLRPYAIKGLESLADQSYITGKNVITDIIDRRPLGQIVRNRGKEAAIDLAEKGLNSIKRKMGKQSGSGSINRRSRKRRRLVGGKRHKKSKQIGGRRVKRRNKRRTKKRVLDIFN